MKYGGERGSTGSPTHDPPAVSRHKLMKDVFLQREMGETLPKNPVTKIVVAVGLGCGEVLLAPTKP